MQGQDQPPRPATSADEAKELDLTDEVVQEKSADPSTKIEERREDTRKKISFILLSLLAAVAAAWVLVAVFTTVTATSPVVSALDKIFAGVLALTGTAVGFFFGSSSSGEKVK